MEWNRLILVQVSLDSGHAAFNLCHSMKFEPIFAPLSADRRHRLGDYLPRLVKAEIEMLAIVHLGIRGEIIARRIGSIGAPAAVSIPLRQLVCDALNLGSLSILIAHNHPSGNPTASFSDIRQTKILQDLLNPLEIELEDHLIITRSAVASMRDLGHI
jgi:DNA repair protein RadC